MTGLPSPDELLAIAIDVAREAGALALSRQEGIEVAATKSSPIDVVTEADRDTEALIRARLSALRPNDGFLGEESGGAAGSTGITWVVDPIDGTVNYLYGIPAWSVSIAAVQSPNADAAADPQTWTALAGVVFNPVNGELFSATAGGGAWLGDRRLAVNTGIPLDRALIATGFSYSLAARDEQLATLTRLGREVRDIRRIGSAALDLCNVASGRYDGYYERYLNAWDLAAGALIAAEAGAIVRGAGETRPDRLLTFAAGSGLADALHPLVDVLRELP
ncbi:inositol monophosphatase family protein [Naasia lichenicola]|uniref:Inositol-1-monophosphatase n=1 Tax=Naasia lichenicola TaxID=2565933 RepID=A0A4S4FLS6_9MICO|nr:inositol monophosphatase family protein [Naasia lichenicola]THG31044.1 inositol monophosphatase [Naasia lichenicola]